MASSSVENFAGGECAASADPDIRTIDRERAKLKLSHAKLCRLAPISADRWWRLRQGGEKPAPITVARLKAVLEAVRGAKASDQIVCLQIPLLAPIVRVIMAYLARETAMPVDVMLAQDLTVERGQNAVWLQAARLRQMALYLLIIECDIKGAELARACGVTRQAVSLAKQSVEKMEAGDLAVRDLLARARHVLVGQWG